MRSGGDAEWGTRPPKLHRHQSAVGGGSRSELYLHVHGESLGFALWICEGDSTCTGNPCLERDHDLSIRCHHTAAIGVQSDTPSRLKWP